MTRGRNLKAGWLATAGIVALYGGVIRPHEGLPGINNSKVTGLAEPREEPLGLWHQMGVADQTGRTRGGSPDADKFVVEPHLVQMAMLSEPEAPVAAPQDADSDRKMVRTSSVDLMVQKPAEAAEKIRRLAEGLGGFLVSSQVSGGSDATGGSLIVRVPAARFEQARAEIRKLALRVEDERTEAQDVTRQYIDQAANLRNLRAEEGQYLTILKQARTVKDTLDVSEKLSSVRGQIEQQQAEFEALSKQIETVAINILLRAEAEARVFGLNWRPLYRMKMALRDGLDGLAEYASTMTAIFFYLPAVGLWLGTIMVGAALGWRVLRWAGRRAFGAKITATAPQV
ncbi:MAG TPA: DUF4349 domain-containing protein [Candidatus Sulfotelmatobacter sp.]